jgi:putative flippase GtrA
MLTPLVGWHALALPGSLGTPETLGRVIAIGLAAIYSFAAHKYFTFNRGLRLPLFDVLRSVRQGAANARG